MKVSKPKDNELLYETGTLMDIIEELKLITNKLDELDNYTQTLGDKLSIEDKKTSDLLHYIENNKLSAFECYRLIKEMKNIRTNRRKIKNDIELAKAFDINKNKLMLKDNRIFLINELHKRDKQLKTKYVNRYYQEEDLQMMLKGVS